MAARGRRAGTSGGTREAILKAARALFAKKGFRGTTLRAIAARARVDMALVSYFFGSKEKLFESAIDLPGIARGLEELLQDPAPNVGERIVRFHLEHVFGDHQQGISAMLRAALGDPDQMPTLRALIREALLEGTARAIQRPDARLRAELFGAQMTGLFVIRYLVRVEPLASASVDEIAARLGPTVEFILGLPSSGASSSPSALPGHQEVDS